MIQRLRMAVAMVAVTAACGVAQAAGVDLERLDQAMPGPRAQVLVLGSVHLSELGDGFKAESLEPVLARLAAFQPDVITIENIDGEGCDLFARHPGVYPADNLAPYCFDTAPAKKATGLDVPAAIVEAKRLLAGWPARPEPAQRRRLAATFMAAGDPASALVQWLQLPTRERRVGDGLDEALVAALVKRANGRNESNVLAAVLAARLGLQRVYPIDDHTGDNVDITDEQGFEKAVRAAWDAGRPKAAAMRARVQELEKAGDLLALYRYINRPEVQQLAIESDFGAAMGDPSQGRFGRMYVAGWETRNLRMVANIRAAFRERPGARVLSVVGSSHKPWFDALLAQMQGVDIVDAERVLAAEIPTR